MERSSLKLLAMGLIFGGMALCFTLVGAPLGIPMAVTGAYLWRRYDFGDD